MLCDGLTATLASLLGMMLGRSVVVNGRKYVHLVPLAAEGYAPQRKV